MAPPNRTARVAVLGSSVQRSRSSKHAAGRARSAVLRRVVLAVLVLLALALLTISFRSPTSGALHNVQGTGASILRPFQVAAERVARPFRDAYGYVAGLSSAKSENTKLRREVRDWRAEAIANRAAASRATELERLLSYEQGPTYPTNYRPVNTSVISFPTGPFAQQVAIAAGSGSGITLNTPVVSADGLVGRVTNVAPSTAVVTLLTDPDSAVAAKDRGEPGLPLGWVNPFDAEDADAALLKIGDELADGVRAEIYGGQIERDVLAGKNLSERPELASRSESQSTIGGWGVMAKAR